MYQYQPPLEVNDFSGGKTDNYIEGPLNQGQEFDNFYVLKNRKILTVPGLTFYISSAASAAQLTTGNQRVNALIKHRANVELFAVSARVMNYASSSVWTVLAGPVDSNPALSSNATTNYLSWADWRGHSVIVSDSYADPIKVFRNNSSVYQVRTAGMPPITLEGAIDLANDLKSKYNLHRVQGTRHVTNDTTNIVASADAYDFDTLVTLVTELTTDLNAHFTDAALASAWAFHAAQESPTSVLAATTAVTTLAEILTRIDDIKTKYNQHDANTTTHNAGSLNAVSVTRTPSISVGAGTGTYLYRFLFYYSYYVDDVLHEDFGPTTQVTLSSAGTGTKSISQIPVISNGTTRCYDTATIKCYIYRTIESGTTFYYVGSVTNGTTTYSDTTSDATLVSNATLYTTGGVKDNDPPPRAKFFTAVNDIGVYAGLKIGTQSYPNSFITSIPGDVDSVPGSFQDEVEDAITGLANFGIYPFLFCRNRIYRLEGIIDEQGRGTVFKREVSRTKGSVSNLGIVQIPQGLVFPGEDGFYFCDGFNPPQIISIHLITSYKDLVPSTTVEKKIYGEYDSAENRVLWAVSDDASISENNAMWCLDLNYPISASSVFTTQHGQGTSYRPTALAFYNREMVHADSRGYILKHNSNTTTHLKVDTTVAASTWSTYAIIWNYKSCAFNFGSSAIYKWVPIITLEAKNEINTTISIRSNKNDGGEFLALKEIRSRDNITWGDPTILWGATSPAYFWNVARLITAKRRFLSGSMRTMLKQIQITNANTIIYRSDDYAVVSTDGTANTCTLSSSTWPTDVVDHTIYFSTDSYVQGYTISARTSSTVLTLTDPTNALATGSSVKWQIKGYSKGETLNLISYAINYAYIGQIQTTWKGDTGANA